MRSDSSGPVALAHDVRGTGPPVLFLHGLGGSMRYWEPVLGHLDGRMCRFRPVAIALAPLLVRDLPAAVAADGARHTWPAYSRTLRRVVLDHDAAADLAALSAPVTIIQGADDRVAPPELGSRVIEALPAEARHHIALQVVDADHHVVHRSPATIAEAIVRRGA